MFSGAALRLRSRFEVFTPGVLKSAVLILILLALAVQCARLVWAVITPLGPVGEWRPSLVGRSAIAEAQDFDPFFRLQTAAPATIVVTSLALTLFGVRVDSANGRGSAIIAAPDGVQSSFAVGDEIVAGVTLKSVAFDSVTIDRSGVAEQLFLDQSVAAPVVQPPNIPTATPAPANAAFTATLQSNIDAAPRMAGGALTGLTLTPKGSGTLFDSAGLKAGDVLTAINGKPISGINDIAQISPSGDGTVSLQVERAGRTMTLSAKAKP